MTSSSFSPLLAGEGQGERFPLVKVCGVSRPEHARVAAEAGADFVGVVFYPKSIRNVSPSEARVVAEATREASGGRTRVVGLFVNAVPEMINLVVDEVGLDLIQLSGDETPEILLALSRPAIGTVRIGSAGRNDEEAAFRAWTTATPRPFAVHLDSKVAGMYGGTGTVADWYVAADFARRYPVFLAGGLAPDNVVQAIRVVRPAVVDVSSGVETDGVKDSEKIRAFVHAAKHAQATAAAAASQGGNR